MSIQIDPKRIQQKILGLIDEHIDHIKGQKEFTEFTSADLTRYLKIVTEFVEHQDKQLEIELNVSDEEANRLILEYAKEINGQTTVSKIPARAKATKAIPD